jgi:hypothetical protein
MDKWLLRHEKLILCAGFAVAVVAVYMLVAW